MDSTMQRTKKYLAYFGKSFLRDKVVITLLVMILCMIGAIIGVACFGGNSSSNGSSTTDPNANTTTAAISAA
jgi:hypothetical protein